MGGLGLQNLLRNQGGQRSGNHDSDVTNQEQGFSYLRTTVLLETSWSCAKFSARFLKTPKDIKERDILDPIMMHLSLGTGCPTILFTLLLC